MGDWIRRNRASFDLDIDVGETKGPGDRVAAGIRARFALLAIAACIGLMTGIVIGPGSSRHGDDAIARPDAALAANWTASTNG